MIIEVRTFRITSDEPTFLAADKALQEELMLRNRGMLRRTTARGDDGEWLVLTLWDSPDAREEPAGEFARCVDSGSVAVRLYEDLGG